MARVKVTYYDMYLTSRDEAIQGSSLTTRSAYGMLQNQITTFLTTLLGELSQTAQVVSVSVIEHPEWVEETPGT